ncbi:hypothetical protein C0995_003575, partial [Termitomyces sp. Mi166
MHTPWINALLASGAAYSMLALDNALNSTAHAVNATVYIAQATTAHAVGRWDVFRQDFSDAVRVALQPVYEWCIDDSLVSPSVSVPSFASPTSPPSAFWSAEAAAEPSPTPSPSYISESLPSSSSAPLLKRVPLPTPASRLEPNAV